MVAVALFQQAQSEQALARKVWISAAGITGGCGIWATHFIGMLAYEPDISQSYDIPRTVLSLIAAIAMMSMAFGISSNRRSRALVLAGGGLAGIGIALMHYVGMSALQGDQVWSPDFVYASIALGVGFAAAALYAAASRISWFGALGGASLLTLAITSLHFVAMSGVEIASDPGSAGISALSPRLIAVTVAICAVIVLTVGAASAVVDQRMRHQGLQLHTAMDNMRQGLVMFDAEQRLVVFNRRYADMYGLSERSITPGCSQRDLLQLRKEAGTFDGDPAACADELLRIAASDAKIMHLPDGRTVSVTMQRTDGGGWVTTHEDVTERRNAEARIKHLALHDALTDLPNRAAFRECLEQALMRKRRGVEFAVHCLDLDRFKLVNDTLGHATGDALLRTVCKRLAACVREGDVVARFGGDEFVIMQSDIQRPEDAATLAQRVIDAVSQPYALDGNSVIVGVSIGIALCSAPQVEADEVLRSADLALYRAKSDGRGIYRFFEPKMDEQLRARRRMETDLRAALARGEFQLHYQPLVDVKTEAVTSCEALLRWRHPETGMVSPADFIPLAEETGMIEPIGEWVLNEACKEAAGWPSDVKIAVNLSPTQFRGDLVALVSKALATSGLPACRLELEITESVLLLDNEATLATLHRLREIGVQIAMDDFGTGYSSLGYLRSFPFDKIKIDRSFISELGQNRDCAAIVKAVAGIGQALGIAITAEGVENRAQFDRIRAEGCTQVQGFLFGRPCSREAIRNVIGQPHTALAA
jgi:diguanylate cyclase (GGDEF)-like protein